ncbi:hypothetical protein D3C84_1156290 [compost metagenome]
MVIQGDGAGADRSGLLVDGRVSLLEAAVDPDPEPAFVTKTPTDVEVAAQLRVHGITAGEAGQVLVEGSLGDHVDHAAHGAVG